METKQNRTKPHILSYYNCTPATFFFFVCRKITSELVPTVLPLPLRVVFVESPAVNVFVRAARVGNGGTGARRPRSCVPSPAASAPPSTARTISGTFLSRSFFSGPVLARAVFCAPPGAAAEVARGPRRRRERSGKREGFPRGRIA